jgi:hypothetical protein
MLVSDATNRFLPWNMIKKAPYNYVAAYQAAHGDKSFDCANQTNICRYPSLLLEKVHLSKMTHGLETPGDW